MTREIRDAAPDERPAVVALTRSGYAEFASIMAPAAWDGFRSAMEGVIADSGPAQVIVAVEDGEIVGSVFLYPGGSAPYPGSAPLPEPEFRLLSVAPSQRGKGTGRALVEECVRRSREAGATELGLHTSMSFRAAVAMYLAMGFERVPERDFQPPGAELVEGYRLKL